MFQRLVLWQWSDEGLRTPDLRTLVDSLIRSVMEFPWSLEVLKWPFGSLLGLHESKSVLQLLLFLQAEGMNRSEVRWTSVNNEREVLYWLLSLEHCWCPSMGVDREWMQPGAGGVNRTMHSCFYLLLRGHLFNLSSTEKQSHFFDLGGIYNVSCQAFFVCFCVWVHACAHVLSIWNGLVDYSKEQALDGRICFGFGVKLNRP